MLPFLSHPVYFSWHPSSNFGNFALEAIRLEPKYAEAYHGRGSAYSEKEEYDKAIFNFNEVLRLDPKNAAAYHDRGVAYFYKEDYNNAISNFNEVLRLEPNDANTYYNRGVAYKNKGDYNRAIADYKSALRIDPNHSDAQEALENIPSSAAGGTKGGVFTDKRDGKKYRTVKIGNQTWMAENLNYNTSGSKCYENNSGNCAKYGRLYNWNTAMNACPSGWHLPSKSEYETLDRAVGGEKVAGRKLKAKSGWNYNSNGTDEFGFSALPGGFGRSDGSFDGAGGDGYWWSASEYSSNNAYYRSMGYGLDHAYWVSNYKSYLFSVRCLQD